MINVVLVEPEIPQNTGNIARSCALSGARLHLVEPLGFSLEEKHLKRAGLDYWDKLDLIVHASLDVFLERHGDERIYLISTKANRTIFEEKYEDDVYFLFGKETGGLPNWLHKRYLKSRLRIPMLEGEGLRSLNLSNAVAILIYEAWRQKDFA